MPLDKGTCLRFYKRKDIQEALVEHAQGKEFSVRYNDSFGKRPDALMYPKEVLELALKGATSFHCSEELWDNPLELSTGLSPKELEKIRVGWDLVLDIDCKFIDYSKICADLIVKLLRNCEVKDLFVKFSGNKGFHIGVPFEAFPSTVGTIETKTLFPEAAKKIAAYVKENIKEELGKKILAFENNDFGKVKEKVELEAGEIISYHKNSYGDKVAKLNVDKFLEIDTVLISSRHLYRMPYSLHEKSGLVSLPIDPDKVMEFQREMAHPDKVLTPMFMFMDREKVTPGNAKRLLVQALDFEVKVTPPEREKITNAGTDFEGEEIIIPAPIKEEFFPPCVKLLLKGIDDGKKRAVFCMSNFLGKVGWSKKEIEQFLVEWNQEKNSDKLRDNYVINQLRYFNPGEKLPPNCDNDAYYRSIGVCKPDSLCAHIRNPVNYTLLRWKDHLKIREGEEKQEKKEEKRRKKEETERMKEEKEKAKGEKVREENNKEGEKDSKTERNDKPSALTI
ncbi:hypothetical protein HZC30_05175 [Candidatus Woesearchaeota archaeon]|nr:hypothetical protein [Candidatus Woesearchaeota archaeon]